MSQKYWQTKAFRDLQKIWNEKLREAGFEDAEALINGQLVLRQRATNSYRGISDVQRENKILYYELLAQNTYLEAFCDRVDRLVMERRSQGIKIKVISEELRQLGERCHRETIRHIIRKYEVKWKIRKTDT